MPGGDGVDLLLRQRREDEVRKASLQRERLGFVECELHQMGAGARQFRAVGLDRLAQLLQVFIARLGQGPPQRAGEALGPGVHIQFHGC